MKRERKTPTGADDAPRPSRVEVMDVTIGSPDTPEQADQMERLKTLHQTLRAEFDTLARVCGEAGVTYFLLVGNPGEVSAILADFLPQAANSQTAEHIWRVVMDGWEPVPPQVAGLVRRAIQQMQDEGLFPTTGRKEGEPDEFPH